MSLSLFEAFDLKHDYLVKVLKDYPIPVDSALYMDTEVIQIADGNDAPNVWEWTILTFDDGKPVSNGYARD